MYQWYLIKIDMYLQDQQISPDFGAQKFLCNNLDLITRVDFAVTYQTSKISVK